MPVFLTRDELVEFQRAEIERLRKLAKELSDALIKVRPLGGSEMFRRVGADFYADPDYCGKAIEKMSADLHEARKAKIRALKAAQ